jgi:hypothetical protein
MNNHARYMTAMKKLAGANKHTCRHPGCQTMVMGAYCMEHIEQAIAQKWDEIETADKPRPTGEQPCSRIK